MASSSESDLPWFLKSSYPVLFPFDDAVRLPQVEFEECIRQMIGDRHKRSLLLDKREAHFATMADADESETFTLVSNSTSAEIRQAMEATNFLSHASQDSETIRESPAAQEPEAEEAKPAQSNPFMEGLISYGNQEPSRNLENMMFTENGDLAYRSSQDALVDLFQELEEVVSGPHLKDLLTRAWQENPLATLRIIFNARSIHLGKSSRTVFYRCAGWLAQNHPLTLVANLCWLSRPVINKKAEKKEDDDLVLVEEENDDDSTKFDVKNGVAHGYWKDLLNILAIAANDKLTVVDDPKEVLNIENPGIIRGKSINKPRHQQNRKVDPKELRRETRENRHETAQVLFKTDPVYRALHLTIARLFAEQLKKDIQALRGDDKAKRSISLCGKWAPSPDHFHDRHTFIVSTIAEIMYPRASIYHPILSPRDDHEKYLRFAREQYRKDTSALRKQLEIVERDISVKKYENIKYDRVPSLAMNQYSKLFIENDAERFGKYLDKVAEGKANISGATLLPSTLIQKVRMGGSSDRSGANKLLDQKVAEIEAKVLDGQWNTLVKRIKDSGTMDSCIAVCDVSGSMNSPVFKDKTTPIDSAIGLSLLLAEVAKPPFAGTFITFSENPRVEEVDLSKTLREKYWAMHRSEWGMSTNFVSVFEDLILPMALQNKLKQEDMIKRVFVFSDMQFNDASSSDSRYYQGWASERPSSWSTSFERIKAKFEKAGYELPELVFWNLAGGRAGYTGSGGDPTAPKPVKADEDGTCLVSGYSQGLLKVFLEGGGFEEEDEEVVVEKDEKGNVTQKTKKVKMTPLKIVQKAISHKAYEMLKVVD
ncbi:hypothetical protein FOC4_g10012069 [Fusarium odoratissimum]|uniref:DUF2828 domain-containing protein n=1 Tax=Fusarium oxysporum f. sp. cubense (strain race 4) TaxID=2502994 RepID=N1R788_FUSC4|nr:hypothetical protein FOC4_g10012069 [Fusarium odoratissimum]